MTTLFRKALFLLAVVALLTSGCAATSTQSDLNTKDASFSNFLVIGVAGDYNSRAQFERETVSNLRNKGASASAYYSIVGGNKPITAEDVRAAVQSGNFDSVLVTRVIDRQTDLKVNKDRESTDATPIGGGLVNLFRYDYTDYKNPGSIDLKTNVTLASELYSAATEEVVWTMEHSSKGETNLGLLIDETAATVVNQLNRDNLISR